MQSRLWCHIWVHYFIGRVAQHWIRSNCCHTKSILWWKPNYWHGKYSSLFCIVRFTFKFTNFLKFFSWNFHWTIQRFPIKEPTISTIFCQKLNLIESDTNEIYDVLANILLFYFRELLRASTKKNFQRQLILRKNYFFCVNMMKTLCLFFSTKKISIALFIGSNWSQFAFYIFVSFYFEQRKQNIIDIQVLMMSLSRYCGIFYLYFAC